MKAQTRKVIRIVEPQPVIEGAGVRLRRSIAGRALDYLDPFLLFDHFASDNPADYLAGFPMHPHRGIETVTYMLEGTVQHRDSMGNAGSIEAGDVQWMTAGGGILHEEMPKPRNGKMAGFQLWVNLPARLKMTAPRYQEIPARLIPEALRPDGVRIRVIAGKADGVTGPVTEIYADPAYLDVTVPAGASFTQPIPAGHACFAYVFEGEGTFGPADAAGAAAASATAEDAAAEDASSPKLLVFGDGDEVTARGGGRGVRFLLASGAPLNEPIARYGPFVMNTREEILQALEDLRNGTFVR